MRRDVVIVSPDDTIQRAALAMGRIESGLLPVGENDRLIGMEHTRRPRTDLWPTDVDVDTRREWLFD